MEAPPGKPGDLPPARSTGKRGTSTRGAGTSALCGSDLHLLGHALAAVRRHLGMDVAFVSEFRGGRRYFRCVDADGKVMPFQPGDWDPLHESYCGRVVQGDLPELMADASIEPGVVGMPASRRLTIGAHMSVPITLSDGRVFGTLCCYSGRPGHHLDQRDLEMLRVFADVVARLVDSGAAKRGESKDAAARVDELLRSAALEIVYQPIVDLEGGRVVGFEALSRFPLGPSRTPEQWFADAARAGRSVELEVLAIRRALEALPRLPDDVYVSVNASPATIVAGHLAEALRGVPLRRVLVEVTEHEAVEQYDELVAAVRPLQERGLRIAIDDAGAGYASFRHILNLAPHMIKLDVSITRGIDVDRSRRALAAALCRFAQETGCRIVAEGVETATELAMLRTLGFRKAQGYLLGRPMPLGEAVVRCKLPAMAVSPAHAGGAAT